MTKEELKQEAEEYVCKRNPLVTKEWFIDAFRKYDKGKKVKYLKDCEIAEYEAYLAGAEPREKRIAELEHQLTHRNCLDCSNHSSKLRMRNLELEKENAELKKHCEDLKEFYEKEYFEIADRTADEKIKELEKYQEEVTVDDYSPYNENTWGMMHEEMYVPKELVRDLLKESYALSEHRKDQLTKAREILEKLLLVSCNSDVLNQYPNCSEVLQARVEAEQFLNSEVEK